MKMFVALVSGMLLSSAAIAQHDHGASTGGGNESAQSREATTEAEASTAGGEAAAEQPAAPSERQICRNIPSSESRMSRHRVCMTAAQWRRHNRNDND